MLVPLAHNIFELVVNKSGLFTLIYIYHDINLMSGGLPCLMLSTKIDLYIILYALLEYVYYGMYCCMIPSLTIIFL